MQQGTEMDKHYHHTLITALIETIASWTDADKDRLASMLGGHCYPGGPVDRQEPGGVEPLRRWRPAGQRPRCSRARAGAGAARSATELPGTVAANVSQFRSRACGRAFDC